MARSTPVSRGPTTTFLSAPRTEEPLPLSPLALAVRPDINAAAHSHSIYGKAFSTLGRNIDIASADGAAFSETVRLYDDFGGVVLVRGPLLALSFLPNPD